MPNRLSNVKSGAKVSFLEGATLKNPEMAARILNVLSTWGKLDTEMGVVFASFLNTQAHIGVAIYNQLTNLNTQDSAMRAAAKLVLDSAQMDLLLAILRLAKGPRDQRNEMAHGVWGFSNDIPDALLLLSPKIALRVRGHIVVASEALRNASLGMSLSGIFEKLATQVSLEEDIWVYRRPDVDEIHSKVSEATTVWSDFAVFMWGLDSATTEPARRRLFGHTAIREAIDRSRADRGESPLPSL